MGANLISRLKKKETILKALIESSLDKLAEDIQDSGLYSYLVKTFPEGKEIVKGKEKEEFEKWLGL